MDSLSQAIHDGDLTTVERIIMSGEGNIKNAFSEAIQAKQSPIIQYLMQFIDSRTLEFIAAEAKYRKNDALFTQILNYLKNPTPKKIPISTPTLPFLSCQMSPDKFSQFEIIYSESLGEGAYGKVYTGIHIPTQTSVAVKIMEKRLISQADLNIIRKECHILSQLNHPNIIKIFGGYEDASNYYWILSLLTYGTLHTYVEYHRSLDWDVKIRILTQIAGGLKYCHDHNIIHRDIKPDNILIGSDLKVVLSDFGYATFQLPGNLFYDFLGTEDFSSPEIKNLQPYDGRAADIWALGITFYYVNYGRMPSDPPEYDADEISDLIRKMLIVNPKKRPNINSIFYFLSGI